MRFSLLSIIIYNNITIGIEIELMKYGQTMNMLTGVK